MKANELMGIIQSRRSVRHYKPDPVPDDVLHRVLEAARWAPSAHNRQPWRFVVLRGAAARAHLADAMAARWHEDNPRADEAPASRIARARRRLIRAPAAVVVGMSMTVMDAYLDAPRRQAERTMAVQSVAMAGQNLLLMAYAEGLGACWLCAPLFCPDVVRRVLALPDDFEALGIITLGYLREQDKNRHKARHPLKEQVIWR